MSPPLRSLPVATDLDPDPDVVEVILEAVPAVVEHVDGTPTSVLAYRDGALEGGAGVVPGPLIEAKQGDRLIVHFRNGLPGFDTTVHWHGLVLPAQMDGNPMVSGAVEPGGSFEYDFVLRDAGLFWYHPHVDTDEQLEMGLQGPLLVHERDVPGYDRERVLVLDDVELAADGSVDLELSRDDAMMGRRDGVVLVNGREAPASLQARPGEIERWRVVNTSNGRFFELALDERPMRVIGWDGGFIAEPYDAKALVVAPGERYDLMVTMPDTGPLMLRSLAFDRGMGEPDAEVDLLEILVEGEPAASTPPPDPQAEVVALPLDGAATRSVELRSDLDGAGGPAFFINDERWPLNSVLEVVSGDVDVWEVVNTEPHHHPFHIHGLFFQVLDRNGVPEDRLGWKDTVVVGPKETVRLGVPYGEIGMWMYHCQIPEHAERGMMSDLQVLPPTK